MKNDQFLKNLPWPKIFSRLFEFSLLALIFGVPLYLSLLFRVSNIFDLTKLFWLRIWLFAAAFFLLAKITALALRREEIYWPGFLSKLKIYWPSLLLIAFLGLSLLWSQDAFQSFFGSYYRNAGIGNWFCYFLLAFLVSVFLANDGPEKLKRNTKNLVGTITLSSSVVAFYAACQYFGFDFMTWQEPAVITHRACSTLFQPNFLASFLLLSIPLAFLGAFLVKKRIFKIIYFLGGALQIAGLVFSGSRGAWISFLLALVILAVIIFWRKNTLAKKTWLLVGVLLVIVLALLALSRNQRFQQVANLSEGSSAYRADIYQAAIFQIKERPWLGYGAENQADRLVREYQKDWGVVESVLLLPDRVHNLFLDLALGFGLIGLAIWLFWYVSLFRLLTLASRKSENYAPALALGLAVFSYLFSLMFSFSVVTTEVYFFVLLGLSWSLAVPASKKKLSFNSKKGLPLILLMIFSAGLFIFSIRAVLADNYFYYFNASWGRHQYANALQWREELVGLGLPDRDYRKMMLSTMVSSQGGYQGETIRPLIFSIAQEDGKYLNPKIWNDAQVLVESAAFRGDYERAEQLSKAWIAIAPSYPKSYFLSAFMEMSAGKYLEARALLGSALNLLPDVGDQRLNDSHRRDLQMVKSEMFFAFGQDEEKLGDFRMASDFYGLCYLSNKQNVAALERIAYCFDQLKEPTRAQAIREMIKDNSQR